MLSRSETSSDEGVIHATPLLTIKSFNSTAALTCRELTWIDWKYTMILESVLCSKEASDENYKAGKEIAKTKDCRTIFHTATHSALSQKLAWTTQVS